ncbi:MAG: DUF4390 domain-containing protein [bacterium]|nr:DUF4390 domain-containing protein [bacterium]
MKSLSLLLFTVLLFLARNVSAQEIKSIETVRTNNKIIVSVALDNDIPAEIFDYLHNGVKVTIVYTVNLYKITPFFYFSDSKIVEIDYKKIVQYNIWEKAYYLEEGKTKFKFQTKGEINKKLMELNSLFLTDEDKLDKTESYYIKVKVNLESVKLFPPLSWIFDLVTVRGFQTSWKTKDLK